jgi:hypothetical protein
MKGIRAVPLALLALMGCVGGGTENSDGSPPQVAIQSPEAGAQVSGQVIIDVLAIDDFAVNKVRILVDGALLGTELYTQPYRAIWNTATLADQSTHVIRAEALDVAGNIGTTSITVTVVKGRT